MKFCDASSILILVGLVAGCDDNTPVCAERETKACFCGDGQRSEQTCEPDGLGFGACDCADDSMGGAEGS